jgi:outer membrane receptor for ferrienterochelin and colicin
MPFFDPVLRAPQRPTLPRRCFAKPLRTVAWAASAVCTGAGAQSPAPQGPQTIVVTASTRAQPIADVQAAVQVISQRELQRYAGTSLTEALQLATGVDARPNGANSTLAIRGIITNAGSPVLVLVDGLKRTAKYAGTNLNLIALEDVERIEVVRGPMSALYGADATGGVINIITKPVGSARNGSGSVRATLGQTRGGQRETFTGGATLNFGLAGAKHRVSVEQRERGLFRFDPDSPTADLGEIDQAFASYSGEFDLTPDHRLGWTAEYLRQRDTSPGLLAAAPPARPTATVFEGVEEERRSFQALRWRGALGRGQFSADVSMGRSVGSTTRSFPTLETTDFRQRQAQIRYALEAGSHQLLLGVGRSQDDLAISITSQRSERHNDHVLLQDEWRLGAGFKLLAGMRRDRFSDLGSVDTPRLSLSWSAGPWTLRYGHGEAFRAPSVLEQYSRFFRGRFLIIGDPALKPEANRTDEIALSWNGRAGSAELTVFDSRVDNLIQSVTRPRQPSDPASVTFRSQYANVAQARIKGVELQGHWRVNGAFSAQWGLDHLDATDAGTGAKLTQRSRWLARLGARYSVGTVTAELRTRQYRGYWNADPNLRGSAPFASNYGTVDLRLDWQAAPGLTLAAGIDNVGDRRQPANWSNTGATMDPPARFAHLGGRYQF